MRPTWKRRLTVVILAGAIYFLPEASRSLVKHALEVLVVLHLGLEALNRMTQG